MNLFGHVIRSYPEDLLRQVSFQQNTAVKAGYWLAAFQLYMCSNRYLGGTILYSEQFYENTIRCPIQQCCHQSNHFTAFASPSSSCFMDIRLLNGRGVTALGWLHMRWCHQWSAWWRHLSTQSICQMTRCYIM